LRPTVQMALQFDSMASHRMAQLQSGPFGRVGKLGDRPTGTAGFVFAPTARTQRPTLRLANPSRHPPQKQRRESQSKGQHPTKNQGRSSSTHKHPAGARPEAAAPSPSKGRTRLTAVFNWARSEQPSEQKRQLAAEVHKSSSIVRRAFFPGFHGPASGRNPTRSRPILSRSRLPWLATLNSF